MSRSPFRLGRRFSLRVLEFVPHFHCEFRVNHNLILPVIPPPEDLRSPGLRLWRTSHDRSMIEASFIVSKGALSLTTSTDVLPPSPRNRSVIHQDVSLSELLLNRFNAVAPTLLVLLDVVSGQCLPLTMGHRNYSNWKPVKRMIIECFQLLMKNPNQVGA